MFKRIRERKLDLVKAEQTALHRSLEDLIVNRDYLKGRLEEIHKEIGNIEKRCIYLHNTALNLEYKIGKDINGV